VSYYEDNARAINTRLRAALDKPVPDEKLYLGSEGFFDPWVDVMDGMVGPYNSEIDDLALDVLRAIRDRTTFEILKDEKRGLAAEMFMHMLAVWLCDYGTSPRGVFPATEEIRGMWDELIAKWESWYAIQWSDDE